MQRLSRLNRSFTLIELVIVVALVAVIAAIALPPMLAARRSGNETSAVGYMKTWVSAQELYREKFGHYADADEQLVDAKLISVANGDGEGYIFSLDNRRGEEWLWHGRGWPEVPGSSGDRYFYVDIRGQVRWAKGRHATKDDPEVGSK